MRSCGRCRLQSVTPCNALSKQILSGIFFTPLIIAAHNVDSGDDISIALAFIPYWILDGLIFCSGCAGGILGVMDAFRDDWQDMLAVICAGIAGALVSSRHRFL